MASPVAHTLAGAIIYLAASRNGPIRWGQFWTVIVAANLADFDLIPGILMGDHSMFHRTFSHSFLAVICVTGLLYLATFRLRPAEPTKLIIMVTLALLSQLLIDWVTFDGVAPQGIILFWPFNMEAFMYKHSIFLNIERNHVTSLPVIIHNLKAVGLEILVLGGPFFLLWWLRARRTAA